MEIEKYNFDDLCLLVQNGFQIVGVTNGGVVIEYSSAAVDAQQLAQRAIDNCCKNCPYFRSGNCDPSADDTTPATIYAKL